MRFHETTLPGAFVVEIERHEDERGYFARSWARDEFALHGLDMEVVHCNVSYNRRRGTLRGLHFQRAPYEEAKLVRCTRGAIYDVAVDLRHGSSTRGQWLTTELTADNGRMLYVPRGFAHGFQTLEDHTEVFYQMDAAYVPGSSDGLRWNDEQLAIPWPIPDPIVSRRDALLPGFDG